MKEQFSVTMNFDSDREKDIVGVLKMLQNRRNLSRFVASLVRIALDSPEWFCDKDSEFLKEVIKYDITPVRYEATEKVVEETHKMKEKLDELYKMNVELYTAIKAGKVVGAEDAVKNQLAANFIMQRRNYALAELVGVTGGFGVYESEKVHSVEEFAEKSLEYILETYGDILCLDKEKDGHNASDINNQMNFNDALLKLGEMLCNKIDGMKLVETHEESTCAGQSVVQSNIVNDSSNVQVVEQKVVQPVYTDTQSEESVGIDDVDIGNAMAAAACLL